MQLPAKPATSAEPEGDRGQSALTQLRAYLAQKELPPATRLPPERELSEILGVSRGDLRKALAILERQGELWRHVGKGTFIGARPVAELVSVAAIAAQTNPAEVMRARLVIEPELAREAALHATADDIEAMRLCVTGARGAETWRQYESWDNRLHRAIAAGRAQCAAARRLRHGERRAPHRRLGPAPRRRPAAARRPSQLCRARGDRRRHRGARPRSGGQAACACT